MQLLKDATITRILKDIIVTGSKIDFLFIKNSNNHKQLCQNKVEKTFFTKNKSEFQTVLYIYEMHKTWTKR